MKVFSKQKFIACTGDLDYKINKIWVDFCDGLDYEKLKEQGFAIKEEWLVKKSDNTCIHCGNNLKEYCEKCYQELVAENAKLQLEVDNKERTLKRLENVRLKEKSTSEEMKKIIQLMAEQLVGLPIVGDEFGEILIPQTEAEVIDYYKGENSMSEADEMFETLGYEKTRDGIDCWCIFENKIHKISFEKNIKAIFFEDKKDNITLIKNEVLQAINEKVKELRLGRKLGD